MQWTCKVSSNIRKSIFFVIELRLRLERNFWAYNDMMNGIESLLDLIIHFCPSLTFHWWKDRYQETIFKMDPKLLFQKLHSTWIKQQSFKRNIIRKLGMILPTRNSLLLFFFFLAFPIVWIIDAIVSFRAPPSPITFCGKAESLVLSVINILRKPIPLFLPACLDPLISCNLSHRRQFPGDSFQLGGRWCPNRNALRRAS